MSEEEIFEDLEEDPKPDEHAEVQLDKIGDDDVEIEIEDPKDDEEKTEVVEKKPKENYSAKVRKRIEREKRVTERERARANNLEQELNDTKHQLDRLQQNSMDSNIDGIDDMIDAAKVRLAAAIEAGETNEQVEQQNDLSKLVAQKIQAVRDKSEYLPPQQRTHTNDKAENWISGNVSWYNINEAATKAANAIDTSLTNEGYDQETDEYFDELNRRLSRRFPDLIDHEEAAVKKSKPVSAGVEQTPAEAKIRRSKGKVTLTQRDLSNMRSFGLDPSNPEHLKAHAKSILDLGEE